jgi:hypothetical protein
MKMPGDVKHKSRPCAATGIVEGRFSKGGLFRRTFTEMKKKDPRDLSPGSYMTMK